jgi:hypothetical protein
MARSATVRGSGTRHRDPAQPRARAAEHSGADVTARVTVLGRSRAAARGQQCSGTAGQQRQWRQQASGTAACKIGQRHDPGQARPRN